MDPQKASSSVIWFTGLSGSGKSTLAELVEKELTGFGNRVFNLDGDVVRNGLCSDLGFSEADRTENIRRVSEVAKMFSEQGYVVLCSFISPLKEIRQMAQTIVGEGNFVEIFVDCPLDVCEERDVKGLYNKVRKGEIENFTGITSPYENPESPDLVIKTHLETERESSIKVINYLKNRGLG